MKVPRLLTIALTLSFFGATGAIASSMWGDFEGYPKARLMVNDSEIAFQENETPAFLVNGSAVIPARLLSESIQAIVKWDQSTRTVMIDKPNVHMFVAKKVNDDYSIKQPFGGVKKGDRLDFAVFAQADRFTTPIHSFRISIDSPSGAQVAVHDKTVNGQKDSFWYTWPFNVAFNEAGDYVVKFSVQTTEDSKYVVISEKVIVSE